MLEKLFGARSFNDFIDHLISKIVAKDIFNRLIQVEKWGFSPSVCRHATFLTSSNRFNLFFYGSNYCPCILGCWALIAPTLITHF